MAYRIMIDDKEKFLKDINLLFLDVNTDKQVKVTGEMFKLNQKIIYKPERGYAKLRQSLYVLGSVICLVILALGVSLGIFDHKKRKMEKME